MCFVPMKFNMANITVGQYHNCDAFQLFPATATMDFLQVVKSRIREPTAIVSMN